MSGHIRKITPNTNRPTAYGKSPPEIFPDRTIRRLRHNEHIQPERRRHQPDLSEQHDEDTEPHWAVPQRLDHRPHDRHRQRDDRDLGREPRHRPRPDRWRGRARRSLRISHHLGGAARRRRCLGHRPPDLTHQDRDRSKKKAHRVPGRVGVRRIPTCGRRRTRARTNCSTSGDFMPSSPLSTPPISMSSPTSSTAITRSSSRSTRT